MFAVLPCGECLMPFSGSVVNLSVPGSKRFTDPRHSAGRAEVRPRSVPD